MNEPEVLPATPGTAMPREGLVRLTHLIYALHSLALLFGILTSATIIGSFISGVPSVVAVILNYVKRSEVRGTWLDSHFRWQIRTFWFALLWMVVAIFLAVTILGIPLAIALVAGTGIWIIYRVARGWLALNNRNGMPV